jgi:hypothetical protein
MRFVVEIDAGMEKANAIDASGGPGAMLAKLGERFKPEAVYIAKLPELLQKK